MAQKWPQAVTEVSDMLVLKFLVEHGHDKVAKKFEAARNVPDIGGLFSLRLEGLLDFFAEETSMRDRKRKQGLVGSGKGRGTSSLKKPEVSSASDSESSTSEEETDEEDDVDSSIIDVDGSDDDGGVMIIDSEGSSSSDADTITIDDSESADSDDALNNSGIKPDKSRERKIRRVPGAAPAVKAPKLSEEVIKKFEGKDLCNDWCSIKEAFGDLYGKLDISNEMDKVVKFILDADILIRALDAKYNNFSPAVKNDQFLELTELAKTNHLIQLGRFRPGKDGEDEIIGKNWKELVEGADIRDSLGCLRQFHSLNRKTCRDVSELRKRNVLGCYLGQKLPFIRFCMSVFYRAVAILLPWNKGRFTPEEDALILEKVKENGAQPSTWKELSVLLNKSRPDWIRNRYEKLQFSSTRKVWSKSENEILLRHLFEGKGASSEQIIPTVSLSSFAPLKNELNRPLERIFFHWLDPVKPTLLSYHAGQLHFDWTKDFLEEVARIKIINRLDVNWSYFQAKFPTQTPSSMNGRLRCALQKNKTDQPIYKRLEAILPTLKDRRAQPSVARRREELVALYDKIRFSN